MTHSGKSDGVGLGYTLATGKLFGCTFPEFHEFAEALMGSPIWTHEFASEELWKAMRETFEAKALGS